MRRACPGHRGHAFGCVEPCLPADKGPLYRWLVCGVRSMPPRLEVGFRQAVTVRPGVKVLLVQGGEVVVRHPGLGRVVTVQTETGMNHRECYTYLATDLNAGRHL